MFTNLGLCRFLYQSSNRPLRSQLKSMKGLVKTTTLTNYECAILVSCWNVAVFCFLAVRRSCQKRRVLSRFLIVAWIVKRSHFSLPILLFHIYSNSIQRTSFWDAAATKHAAYATTDRDHDTLTQIPSPSLFLPLFCFPRLYMIADSQHLALHSNSTI
jgi:hypothetical protein